MGTDYYGESDMRSLGWISSDKPDPSVDYSKFSDISSVSSDSACEDDNPYTVAWMVKQWEKFHKVLNKLHNIVMFPTGEYMRHLNEVLQYKFCEWHHSCECLIPCEETSDIVEIYMRYGDVCPSF